MIFSQNFVNAAPRKKAVVKRAAVNKSSTKRAAVSGSSKRAATNRAATRKRVVSRVKTSAPVVNETKEVENEEVAVEEPVYASCPVEKVIAGRTDDEGNFAYYNGKDKCVEPENSLPYKWNSSLKSEYPRGTIKESEAYYFKCENNYVVKTVNNERVCVSVLNTCPLNVVLEKTANGFVSPETMEVCSLAPNSQVRSAGEGENTRGDIEDSVAYISECNENKYSAPVEGGDADLHLQCLSCPAGWKSSVGAKSESECVDVEGEKALQEAEARLELEKASIEVETKRLAALRIRKVDDSSDNYTCIDGWTNHWEINGDGMLKEAKIMDKDGVIRNIIDREHYGVNKVGCPVKSTNVLTLDGIKSLGMPNPSLFSSVRVRTGVFLNINRYLYPKVGFLRSKMLASDLDNTGVNGWTDEEYQKWGEYKPVIGLYYEKPSCSSNICLMIWEDKQYDVDKVKAGGVNSESNLFKYWD